MVGPRRPGATVLAVTLLMLWLGGFFITARVTRFLTDDALFVDHVQPVLTVRADGSIREWWQALLDCPWCVSIWVGAPVAAYVTSLDAWPAPAWATFLALWLGWSYVVALVAQNLDGE